MVHLMDNGWKQKTARITEDYNKFCAWLELYALELSTEPKKIYNEIFLYSLDYLLLNGFHYNFKNYEGRREPKGFLLENTTDERIKDSFYQCFNLCLKVFNRKLLMAEFFELLLYVYAMNELEPKHLDYLNTVLKIEWGIELITK